MESEISLKAIEGGISEAYEKLENAKIDPKKEYVFMFGETGSGKSTLIS